MEKSAYYCPQCFKYINITALVRKEDIFFYKFLFNVCPPNVGKLHRCASNDNAKTGFERAENKLETINRDQSKVQKNYCP